MERLAFILNELHRNAKVTGIEKLKTLPNGLHIEVYPDGSLLCWRSHAIPSNMEIMILIRELEYKKVDIIWQEGTARLTPC